MGDPQSACFKQLARISAGGVVLTILGKSILISLVVWLFKFPVRTALAVGLSMAQIGEFAFVLLSVASQLGMLPYQVYMLLMGEVSRSRVLSNLRGAVPPVGHSAC